MIHLREVTKIYRLYRRPWHRVRELVSLGRRNFHQPVVALCQITLNVSGGESVGIIGDNGSGKTTLLRLIAGATCPTNGTIEVKGRVGSLIELGSGFHEQFTARQNIYMNASLLGLTRKQIDERIEEIAHFSELEEYLDWPLRAYSSGMKMRLGFAVATSINPDILAIDEVLSVGDNYFQKKCINRINEYRRKGITILFCSHDLYRVKQACERAIWLHRGRIIEDGPSLQVTENYLSYLRQRMAEETRSSLALPETQPAPPLAKITDVEVLGADGTPKRQFFTREMLAIKVDYQTNEPELAINVGVMISRNDDEHVFGASTQFSSIKPSLKNGKGTVVLKLDPLRLLSGDYFISVYLVDESGLHVYDRAEKICPFNVPFTEKHIGMCMLDHEWIDLTPETNQ